MRFLRWLWKQFVLILSDCNIDLMVASGIMHEFAEHGGKGIFYEPAALGFAYKRESRYWMYDAMTYIVASGKFDYMGIFLHSAPLYEPTSRMIVYGKYTMAQAFAAAFGLTQKEMDETFNRNLGPLEIAEKLEQLAESPRSR